MSRFKAITCIGLVTLKWIARIVGTLLILLLIYLLASYTIGPEKSVPGAAMIAIVGLWTVGVAVAWKWEGLGGLVMLTSSLAFFAIRPDLIWPPFLFHLVPLVAVLLLSSRLGARNLQERRSEREAEIIA